jgi:hypothetical protein
MATPIAAKIGLPALLFVRACMGVGEVSCSTQFCIYMYIYTLYIQTYIHTDI